MVIGENESYEERWEDFIFLTDDLDLYKHVYKKHLDKGFLVDLTISIHDLARLKKDIAEWCLGHIWHNSTKYSRILFTGKFPWDKDTVLYLYEKGLLKSKELWSYMNHYYHLDEYIPKYLQVESEKSIQDLLSEGAGSNVLKIKYEMMGRVPSINDITLAFTPEEFYKDFCN